MVRRKFRGPAPWNILLDALVFVFTVSIHYCSILNIDLQWHRNMKVGVVSRQNSVLEL